MMDINLLPWREERDRRVVRRFFGVSTMAALLGVLLVAGWSWLLTRRVHEQRARNAYLEQALGKLDARVAQADRLEQERAALVKHRETIAQWQSARLRASHLFDALAGTIPDGIRLVQLSKHGNNVRLHGVAQSNTGVADYMRRMNASAWFAAASLERSTGKNDASSTPYTFALSVDLDGTSPPAVPGKAVARTEAQAVARDAVP